MEEDTADHTSEDNMINFVEKMQRAELLKVEPKEFDMYKDQKSSSATMARMFPLSKTEKAILDSLMATNFLTA